MANVPEVSVQNVASQGEQRYGQPAPNAGAGFGELASAISGVSKATQGFSDVYEAHHRVMQDMANKADADIASVNTSQALAQLHTDYTIQAQGKNAVEALPKFIEDANQIRADQAANLQSPMARQMFDASTRIVLGQTIANASAHAATEQDKYERKANAAVIANAQDSLVGNLNNPDIIKSARDTIEMGVAYFGHRDGDDDNIIGQNTEKEWSAGLVKAIKAQAVTDYPAAQAAFDEHQYNMTNDDRAAMAGYLHQVGQPWLANNLADDAMNGRAPEEGASVTQIQAAPEAFFSGIIGKGTVVSSGVRPVDKNTEVGGVANSYHIPGNGVAFDIVPPPGVTLAQAKKAVEASGLKATEIIAEPASAEHGAHLHIGWSKADMAAHSATPAKGFYSLEDLENHYPQAVAALDARIDRDFNGDPQLKASAEARLATQYNVKKGAFMAQADAARGRLITILDDPAHAPMSFDELSPEAKDDYFALSASEKHSVDMQIKRNSNPTLTDMTPQQVNNAMQLDGLADSSPGSFAQINLLTDPRMQGLPRGMAMQLMKRQNAIKGGAPPNSLTQRMITAANPFIQAAARDSNTFPMVNTSNGYTVVDHTSPEYTTFVSALNKNAQDFFSIYKREPDHDQVVQMIRQMMLNGNWRHPETRGIVPGLPNEFVVAAQRDAAARGLNLSTADLKTLYAKKAGK